MHISDVIGNISKIMYMLKRVSQFLNTKSFFLLYNSLIYHNYYSLLRYGEYSLKYNIRKLFYLHKKL